MKRIAVEYKALLIAIAASCAIGCSDETGASGASSGGGATAGVEIKVAVPETGRAFVDLKTPAAISVDGDGSTSTAWDIAFEGFEVYTNSGISGPGQGGALGPYGPDIYVSGKDPASPIITVNAVGGAFLRWYAYDYTNPAHALYSRYHIFGLKDGDRLWKVQILSYYGEISGAPVSALYRLRYAELFDDGSAGQVTELSNVDGTAGGPLGTPDSASGCLDLGTGMVTPLTPNEAAASSAWHLCFRRESVEVNGELGGPLGATAVDMDGAKTPSETVDTVSGKTAESELAHFNAITFAALTDPSLVYRGDREVSIFADQWLGAGGPPAAPQPATWVVVHAADGEARALITFPRFEDPGKSSPGTVVIDVKPVIK